MRRILSRKRKISQENKVVFFQVTRVENKTPKSSWVNGVLASGDGSVKMLKSRTLVVLVETSLFLYHKETGHLDRRSELF